MAGGLMHRIDDGLSVRSNLIDVIVQIENPTERLRRRRDVVALRAETDDRRPNIPKVHGRAVAGLDAAGRKVVADKQLIDDELDLFGIQIDMAAPPALELEITWGFAVDLGIEIILLAPECIRGV